MSFSAKLGGEWRLNNLLIADSLRLLTLVSLLSGDHNHDNENENCILEEKIDWSDI